jgi:hypothetical protein
MTSSTFYAQLSQRTADNEEETTSHVDGVFGEDGDSIPRSPSDVALGAAGTSLVDIIENIVQKES